MQWSRLEVSSWVFLWAKWLFYVEYADLEMIKSSDSMRTIKGLTSILYWIQKKAQLVFYFLLHYFLQVSRELFMGIIIVVASIPSLLLLCNLHFSRGLYSFYFWSFLLLKIQFEFYIWHSSHTVRCLTQCVLQKHTESCKEKLKTSSTLRSNSQLRRFVTLGIGVRRW